MKDAILVGAVVVMGMFWWLIASAKKGSKRSASRILSSGATVASDPLLTETELSLYNLLQIAVQDRYLIFVHLPLWSFISLVARGKTRSRILKDMALKRVDFALMHPGSRRVEQVVLIEEESVLPYHEERGRVIESIVTAAGIKLVKIRSTKSYTIPELTALLGLAAEE